MREQKEITIKAQDETEKTYIISKFFAMDGREIIAKYPTSGLPKIGDYEINKEVMLKIMSYVAVKADDGSLIKLTTEALINNHVPDWETVLRIEYEIMKYNCSPFVIGKISNFFEGIQANVKQLISSTLTDSLGQLLQQTKQSSKN